MRWVRELVPVRSRTTITWIVIALILGFAVRIGWALVRVRHYATGEASYIAIALAEGRGFADGFVAGQGPTAHLMPVSPAIAGFVYWLFGPQTEVSEAILLVWTLSLVAASYILFALAAVRIGVKPVWALVALLFLWAVPIYTSNEVFDYRVWEGGLALALGATFLSIVVRADRGDRPRSFAFWFAVLPPATFFVNGPVGLACVTAWALYLWHWRRRERVIRTMLATAAALVLIVAPWTARNWIVMGHPILLRDNLGMELAVANHPGAIDPEDPEAAFYARLESIQPYLHPGAYAKLQAAGGEVAYSKLLGRETKAWMRANPQAVAHLWVTHLREMLFTRPWMFKTRRSVALPIVRTAIMTVVGIFGLIGLALAAMRRDRRYAYLAAFLVVPVLVYIPFQPIPRYTWLVYPAMVCFAADAVGRMVAAWAPARGGGAGIGRSGLRRRLTGGRAAV